MRTQQRPVVKQYKPQNGQQGCCDYDKLVNETCIIGYKKRLLSEVPSDWGVRITGTFAITNTESPASVGALGHSRCAALQSAAAVCHTDMKGGTRRLYSSPYWPLCTAGKCLKNILKLKWNTNSVGKKKEKILTTKANCSLMKPTVCQFYAFQACTLCGVSFSYPSPRARMCDSSSEGMNTLRNSAEKMPPFFMAPVFLMLSVTERRGWRKWNSLHESQSQFRRRAAHWQHDTCRSWCI